MIDKNTRRITSGYFYVLMTYFPIVARIMAMVSTRVAPDRAAGVVISYFLGSAFGTSSSAPPRRRSRWWF